MSNQESKFENYYEYIQSEANDLLDDVERDIKDVLETGTLELPDFFDELVHDWVDNDFIYIDLLDSAHILQQSNNVEYDSGLWEGQEPIEAVKTQAFFTYRMGLMFEVEDLAKNMLDTFMNELGDEMEDVEEKMEEIDKEIDEINEDEEMAESEKDEKINDLEKDREKLDERYDDLDDTRENARQTYDN